MFAMQDCTFQKQEKYLEENKRKFKEYYNVIREYADFYNFISIKVFCDKWLKQTRF